MSIKVKLPLDDLNAEALKERGTEIVAAITANAANFATPDPTLASVTTLIYNLNLKILAKKALDTQAQAATQQVNAAAELLADALRLLAAYVEKTANKNATAENPATAIAESADMEVADSKTTPVGPMPKVSGLSGTAGDESGEVDLHWDPVKHGCRGFIIQRTTDPAASTGWTFAANSTASKHSLKSLTSATKEWFRVAAIGTAGQGPFSDPVQVTIP